MTDTSSESNESDKVLVVRVRLRRPLGWILIRVMVGLVILIIAILIGNRMNDLLPADKVMIGYGVLIYVYDLIQSRLFDQTSTIRRIFHWVWRMVKGTYDLLIEIFS